MFAVVTIPHQTPAKLHAYENLDEFVEANYDTMQANADDQGWADEQFTAAQTDVGAAVELTVRDLHGHHLIENAAEITYVELAVAQNCHQNHKIAAMLPELREMFPSETVKTKRTIVIACDQDEAAEFAEWLTAEGHDASVGNSTGSYVDGDCTNHDGTANEWLTRQWNNYCNA